MKIVINGAGGYLGRNFAEYLLANRERFQIAHIRVTARKVESLDDLKSAGAEAVAADICNPADAEKICAGMDTVMHCAGRSGLGGPMSYYYKANVEGTRVMLEAARAAGVRRFVNIGTPSIYFDYTDTLNRDENYLPARMPDNYAASKFEAEKLLLAANTPEFQTISLRPRFTTGRGEMNIMRRFITMHKAGRLKIIGSGENVVDYTAISNMVEAMWLAVTAPADACGEAYNITNGDPVKLWPFLNKMMEMLGLPPITGKVPYPVAATAGSVVELISRLRGVQPPLTRLGAAVSAKSMTMNIEKARKKLGYHPKQTNDEMLAEFVGWWKAVK